MWDLQGLETFTKSCCPSAGDPQLRSGKQAQERRATCSESRMGLMSVLARPLAISAPH